jgi:hypothetical protein
MVSQLSYCSAGMNPKKPPLICEPKFAPKPKSLCHAGVDVEFNVSGFTDSPEIEDKKSEGLFVCR